MFDIAGVTSVKTRGFLLFNQSVWRLKSSKNIPSAGLGAGLGAVGHKKAAVGSL